MQRDIQKDAMICERNILAFGEQLSFSQINLLDADRLKTKIKKSKPDGVIIVGMGGSGIPGTILQNLSLYGMIPIKVISWRDFKLPATSFKNPLIIFVSFSGNTRETLSGFEQAKRYPLKAVVTSGGKLLFWAERAKMARATFDPGELAPRQATGVLMYGVLSLIKLAFPKIASEELRGEIIPEHFTHIGQDLAKLFKDNLAVIYTSGALSHLGQIFKININETGKSLASANVFPEINHNELVSFESRPKRVKTLFLVSEDEERTLAKELMIIRKIMNDERADFQTLTIPGRTPLEATFNGLLMAQWTGYHLALIQGLNPLSTKTVDTIKKLV